MAEIETIYLDETKVNVAVMEFGDQTMVTITDKGVFVRGQLFYSKLNWKKIFLEFALQLPRSKPQWSFKFNSTSRTTLNRTYELVCSLKPYLTFTSKVFIPNRSGNGNILENSLQLIFNPFLFYKKCEPLNRSNVKSIEKSKGQQWPSDYNWLDIWRGERLLTSRIEIFAHSL